MKKKVLLGLAVPLAALGVAVLRPTPLQAADHLDGPRASGDPASDITDVYTFMSPDTTNGVGHLVLVMNVFPKANTQSAFSDKVDYVFDIHEITDFTPTISPTPKDVKCTFTNGNPQMVTCATTIGGLTKTVAVNAASPTCAATDNICVWAGLRSDPFYFDLKGFNDTVDSNPQAVKFTGTNFFNGLNVMSIVVEVNALTAFGTGAVLPKAILAVGAHTNRKQ